MFTKRFNQISIAALMGVVVLAGCDKTKVYDTEVAPAGVHFVGSSVQAYTVVVNPAPAYTVTVGTTDVANEDRTVTLKVSSPTGAVSGTQYTLSGTSLVIPAGQATASFTVQANYGSYTTGRKDTLVFTLDEPSIARAGFADTVKLAMRGPCFDSEIVFSGLLGNYTRTYENGTYGPYVSTIAGLVPVNATSSRANITNIYDSGITAQATFDYTTVGAFTVTIPDQGTQYAVGGLQLFLRSTPATTSLFTYCTPSFTLYLDLYTSAGLYDRWTMTMAR